ncbi:hypothetical protein MKEN_01450100 [Mycena kentingensis (nom. inval.)]|nr:hypothetical protein MKEN_01450100 [Mycena kentingensis (nom. inval.)]
MDSIKPLEYSDAVHVPNSFLSKLNRSALAHSTSTQAYGTLTPSPLLSDPFRPGPGSRGIPSFTNLVTNPYISRAASFYHPGETYPHPHATAFVSPTDHASAASTTTAPSRQEIDVSSVPRGSPPLPSASTSTSSSSATPSSSSTRRSHSPATTTAEFIVILPDHPSRAILLEYHQRVGFSKRPGPNNKLELQCPRCSDFIYCPVANGADPSTENHFQAMEAHYGRQKCEKMKKARDREEELRRLTALANAQAVSNENNTPMEGIQATEPQTIPFVVPAPPVFVVSVCNGVPIYWPVTKGSFAQTFPWHRLGNDPRSLSFDVELRDRGRVRVAFSKDCTGSATNGGCCTACYKITREIEHLAQLAEDAPRQTNHVYLGHHQKEARLEELTKEVRALRLKQLNVSRKLGTALRRVADGKHFVSAILNNDLPRLRQLVAVGVRRGASTNAIIRMMQSAVDGAYQPIPTITSRTLDIALLIFRLGGWKLLYAVNQCLDIPSLRTLRNNMSFTRIMPTVGYINTDDIAHNIEEVIVKSLAAAAAASASVSPSPLRGVSLQIDEVAIEERAAHSCYGILGFCWCHSKLLKLSNWTYSDAVKLREQMCNGKAHLGKEMTVVSAFCFGGRQTFPILALPTCKGVGPKESKIIYETAMDAWYRRAASTVGPIWSWATDGDASRPQSRDCLLHAIRA